jgi:hypothetical protein
MLKVDEVDGWNAWWMMVQHTTMVNLEVRLPKKRMPKNNGNKRQNKRKCDQDK